MSFRRNDRREFPRKVRLIAFKKADGHCQECGCELRPGYFEYHHKIPWEISRDSTIGNCAVLCLPCHGIETAQRDIPTIAKSNRVRDRHIGAMSRSRSPMPCGRKSGRTKTMGHGVQPRMTQAEKHRRTMEARRIVVD